MHVLSELGICSSSYDTLGGSGSVHAGYIRQDEERENQKPPDARNPHLSIGIYLYTASLCRRSCPPVPNLQQIALDKGLTHGTAQAGGRALDDDASRLEGLDLGIGTALATGDDGAGVTHATSRGRADAGDEADDGLAAVDGVVLAQEVGGVLLGRATDLTDHDDAVRLLVFEEDLEAVDEVGSAEGVTANADDERLAEAGLRGLVDGLVGQGTGTGDDANATALVDEAGHDADLAPAGGDDAGAVGADEAGLGLAL